jgi:hypothetical protein
MGSAFDQAVRKAGSLAREAVMQISDAPLPMKSFAWQEDGRIGRRAGLGWL